jgi:hypothetical protein
MKYKIGDKVWYAQRKAFSKSVVCPDCFGKKYLTVIKGDDSQVTIDCAGCASGYLPPKGYILYWGQEPDVCEKTISKIEFDGIKYVYGFDGCYSADEDTFFRKESDALIKAGALCREHEQQELARINMKEKNNRTWSWNASYHRRQIKEAERQIEYHTAKLNAAKKHIKEESLTPPTDRHGE